MDSETRYVCVLLKKNAGHLSPVSLKIRESQMGEQIPCFTFNN